jgi:folate-binding protein YgfZ
MTAPNRAATGDLFDFSSRTKLRVSGSDRVRFLNGQITNDVRKATESGLLEACVLNAKGKMEAHIFVRAEPDCLLVDADAELRGSLQVRLERYIIADDVQIEDVTEKLSTFHLVRVSRPALPIDCKVFPAVRLADPGWDIWVDPANREEVFQQLSEQFEFCDADCAEVVRIEQGIPRWGRELTPEIIPIEAHLEARCIDYEKGCYIGQETISRMKMSRQQNKRLCGFVARNGSPLAAGMRLLLPKGEGKEVGWITSATSSRSLAMAIGLGYVKRGFNDTGSRLEAVGGESLTTPVEVDIVDLPFRHVAPQLA